MYEEKTRKIQINWKSLLIKLAILLVVIFLVVWIISLFKKDDRASNFGTNLAMMRDAATEYFTGARLPSEVDESTSITLGEMFDRNLLVEFQDENGNPCDTEASYAEATKIDEENYRIEVRLVCEDDSDTIINTVQRQVTDSDNNVLDDEPIIDDHEETNDPVEENQGNTGTGTNTGSSQNGGSTTTKPNNSGTSSNSNSNHTSSGNNSSSNNNSSNHSSNNTTSNTCTYGKKEYTTTYPLAYVVSGNCAVSASSINGSHANNATKVGNAEYTKLVKEMASLEASTGADLVVSNPQYTRIINKAGTGYVGYQIYFSVKQKVNSYASVTVYSYYLDQNGNRKVIIDSRNSLSNGTSSNPGSVNVTSVTINRTSLTMDVGETYTLSATVKPSNASNKTVSWSSSNTSVASVSSNGKVTAKKKGTATITASAGGKSDTLTVTVNDNGYIELDDARITLNVGDTYRLTYDTNLSGSVSWSSNNTSVASVSSNGKVTAKKKGTATITATINGKSDTIRVTVEEEGYLRILDGDYLTIYVGNSYTLNVDTNLDNLSFQSSDPSVATVSSNGTIRVKGIGGVTITVRSGSYRDTIRIYCLELSYFN